MQQKSSIIQQEIQKGSSSAGCQDCGSQKNLVIFNSKQSLVCESCFDIRQDSLFIPIHKILDRFYLGSLQAIEDSILNQKDIKAICSCGKGLKQPKNVQKFIYKNIPVGDLDEENIYDHFEDFCNWVDQNRKSQQKPNVLIHCAAGASRSASFVISYVMKQNNLGFSQALKYVRSIRRCVNPNDGFKRQLQRWEKHLSQKKQKETK